ncbi:MAG: Uma2 family endonuclease [Microscillaceae bacterium]|jgi:Uma2 family endonuclease|nr:Uma2 family endonuclease [Microscillaceae bacterium]
MQATSTLIEELGYYEGYKFVRQVGNKLIYERTTFHEVELPEEMLEDEYYEQFITEDDTPVDNIFSEKEQRLLIDPLHANAWTKRNFLASSNVGIYYEPSSPAIVPDMFLSFDVKAPEEWFKKKNRCYFVWRMKKAPELVVEVVSNKIGGESKEKMAIYAKMGVMYYVLIDPYMYLYKQRLNLFKLDGQKYEPLPQDEFYLPEIELGIKIWEGLFEKHEAPWGRWCTKEGDILKTGAERTTELSESLEKEAQRAEQEAQRAEQEAQRAEQEAQRAEQEAQRAEQERLEKEAERKRADEERLAKEREQKRAEQQTKRAERLLAQLKALGLEPEED